MSENGTSSAAGLAETRALVLERIREDSSFVLATHENMDGDAIGSLLGMQGLLTALGKDSLMFVPPGSCRCPWNTASSTSLTRSSRRPRTSPSARWCCSTAATSTATRPTRCARGRTC